MKNAITNIIIGFFVSLFLITATVGVYQNAKYWEANAVIRDERVWFPYDFASKEVCPQADCVEVVFQTRAQDGAVKEGYVVFTAEYKKLSVEERVYIAEHYADVKKRVSGDEVIKVYERPFVGRS